MLRILLGLCIKSLCVEKVKIIPKRYFGFLFINWLQSYKLSKLEDVPIIQKSTSGHLDSCCAAEFFSHPQLCQLVTLQPVDLQKSTVPLLKDLNPLNIYIVNSED